MPFCDQMQSGHASPGAACSRRGVFDCRTLPKGQLESIVENIRIYGIHALLVVGGFEVRAAHGRKSPRAQETQGVLPPRGPILKTRVLAGPMQGPRGSGF